MCGIVGYIGARPASDILIEGLHRLEYRGYDSAGVALVHRGRLKVTKAAVRVAELRERLDGGVPATVGIGHTRWATHGEPTDANAHPQVDAANRIAVVHNGMLENADQLRAELTESGVQLRSDTDTEAIAHLVARALDDGAKTLQEAVRTALTKVDGAYGLVVLDARNPGELVVARNGSPIVVGIGDGEMFVASDVAALVRHTQRVVDVDYQLGGYPDFMRKEIDEQPDAVRRALLGRLDERFATARLGGIRMDPRELRGVSRVKFLGCGSAYYAGQIGANLVEELARIPADAEPASEFRYRNPVIEQDTLYVAVSQSGETADTLAAVRELKRKGGQVIGVVNAVGSAIARECGSGVFLHAGPEVSVASTKAVTN